ncbi:hypothetical protein SLEP1_g25943 [Rubroshorea leprosula]|uniref:Uncharacterized protein n=1 Tax=Rubroshorea leprosula TaxID=152421 RepID=A0AAV5JR10_9ROSI|nr:hypothetical protein SLEP1_g25943 [Rubroshorea leprosula]
MAPSGSHDSPQCENPTAETSQRTSSSSSSQPQIDLETVLVLTSGEVQATSSGGGNVRQLVSQFERMMTQEKMGKK